MRLSLLALALLLFSPDFDAAEKTLRSQLGNGFHVRRSEVFVCAGDVSKAEFDSIVDGTVTACAKALWKQYFNKRPDYPIRVYLFGDERTYRAYAKKLFDDTDVSYFGYFKPDEKALVMNIGTGTGTLVHEMVHALMEPDFPAAPTWFSEGLASLYEQCRVERDGLVGLVNWRLPVLRRGLQNKTTLPLAKLIATSRAEFLDENTGVHYAQARYLCQFMQERSVLREFYRTYRDGFKNDKTGAKALQKVFGKTVAEIEKEWLKWVAEF
jgi:hypothetical protein